METLPVTISPSELIEFLCINLNNLPDKRKGLNIRYSIRDAVLACIIHERIEKKPESLMPSGIWRFEPNNSL